MTDWSGYSRVTSALFGIIRAVSEAEQRPENALIHVITAATGEIDRLVGGGLPVIGSGASIAHEDALRSAIGEVLERYSAKWVPRRDTIYASYADLDETAPHPAGFALFHSSQYGDPGFPFVPFTENTFVTWVRAVELASDGPSWLPVQLVYLHHDQATTENPISYSTSSGIACALTYEDALLKALLEVLERDATMVAWYIRYSPPLIDISCDSELKAIEQNYFAVQGAHHLALDLSGMHGVPTVLALVEDEDPAVGGAAFGSACALDARSAWLKAMTEAYHTRLWTLNLRRAERRPIRRPLDVRALEDHVRFYAVPENSRYLAFFRNPQTSVRIDRLPSWRCRTPADAVSGIARSLESSGASTYAVEITAPDVMDAGFRVARVVCPELCRIDVPYTARHLGGDRLYTAAASLGLTDRRLDLDDLNPYPHPFP